jgi:hypothetical protein
MRDFAGGPDLSFTPEEQEAIRRAAGPQPLGPQPAPGWPGAIPRPAPFPLRRKVFCALGICALVWWMAPTNLFQLETSRQAAPRHVVTVALARRAVHLRQGPSVAAASLGVIPVGSVVTVEEQRLDGFCRVTHSNQQGYAAAAYLALSGGVELTPHIATRVGLIAGNARVREQGSGTAGAVAALPSSSPVTVLGFTTGGWCLVWTGTRAGFVWAGLLEENPSLPLRVRQEGADRVVVYDRKVLRP